MGELVFVLNPGTTSTKVALYEGDQRLFCENVRHSSEELSRFPAIIDQLAYRKEIIDAALSRAGVSLKGLAAAASQGGGLYPCASGVYQVDETLIRDQELGVEGGQHPANLGGPLAKAYCDQYGGQPFVVDPPSMDEFQAVARVTGMVNVLRRSRAHALNIKAAAHRAAAQLGKPYEDCNLILCHMGGGTTVGAQRAGRMIDAMDCLMGDGAFAATRAGAIPAGEIVRQCFSGNYTEQEMMNRLMKCGGLVEHLGTSDALEILERIQDGDRYAKLVFDAMLYQVGKQIGAFAAALHFDVDAIVLTGGMAHGQEVTGGICAMVEKIAPILVYPGEFEMEAMRDGALRVLRAQEQALRYESRKPSGNLRDYLPE